MIFFKLATVFRGKAPFIFNQRQFIADRANTLQTSIGTSLDEVIKQRDKAANDLFSTAVSTIRQPIESLFN